MTAPDEPRGSWRLRRDSLGIPHLWADDEPTLAYAQGYVTASDRGWQLETDRWRAEGTLAARIGGPGLAWDTLARQLRTAETARRAYARLSDSDRTWVDAYTHGVNAGLVRGRETPEIAAIRELAGTHPVDELWPAWMPLAILHVNHVLFTGFPNVLWRAHIARTLGPRHPDVPVTQLIDMLSGADWHTGGSNAWALAGTRTASGRPILAGDPHRILELPGIYQQIRLACPEYDVVGLAFAGVPGIAHFGHTGTAAWGVTNAVAHHVDVYVEHLVDRSGRWVATGPDGEELVRTGIDTIEVRGTDGDDDRTIPVQWGQTARGLLLDLPVTPTERTATSVRIPAHESADLGISALRPLLRSQSAADVVDAFGSWLDPVNRVLAADQNSVVSVTAGHVPDLDREHRRLPRDGRTSSPVQVRRRVPAVEVMTSAVDANQRPGADTDHGFAYAPPDRAHRIATLLQGADAPTTADAQYRIHADTYLPSAGSLINRLDALPDDALSDAAAQARSSLIAWDRQMDAASTVASLYVDWRTAIVDHLGQLDALSPLRAPHRHSAVLNPWFAVEPRIAAVLPELLDASWLDIDVPRILTITLESVAHGEATPWGSRHTLYPVHLHEDAHLAPPRTPHTALAGDSECVLATVSIPGSTHVFSGPVARWVWDLDDRTRSRWTVLFGASGDPRSCHHTDQLQTWAQGQTTQIEFPELQEL